jgi:hypothetical protein
MRAGAVLLAALALGVVSAQVGGAAPVGTSGLRGVVHRSLPVCLDDDGDCTAPAPGVVLRFSRAGTLVARATTGPAGGYVVRLRPGVYTVTTPAARVGRDLVPRRVTVPVGRIARVDFRLDTGVQ